MDDIKKINYAELFKENRHVLVKKFISKELSDFLYNYTLLKAKSVETLVLNATIPPDSLLGGYTEAQVPGSFGAYADFAMETLLADITPKMEQVTGLRLCPTYSYQRIYKHNQSLDRHKDRPSCEVSATLCLGYDNSNRSDGYNWGMFIEKSGEVGLEGKEIKLEPGDLIVYRGCDLEHWREPFQGNILSQVFLHYNDIDGQFGESFKYDKRAMLGLPAVQKRQ